MKQGIKLSTFSLDAKRVIGIFKEISKIPHCSSNTAELFQFIVDFAKASQYKVLHDSAKNILCFRDNPKVCFQSHYDMVCIDTVFPIPLIIKDNKMSAKGSSLGADNGIGCAMMLALMEQGYCGEFLFTNDEEIGLIGANNLELDIVSPYLLNLDSESEGEVYIGCAGGFDVEVQIPHKRTELDAFTYKIVTQKFEGGHSGVDIEKGIKNAIIESIYYLSQYNVTLHKIDGGERRNAIPRDVSCIVSSPKRIDWTEDDRFKVEEIQNSDSLFNLDTVVKIFLAFSDGVRGWDYYNNVPNKSLNCALIKTDETFTSMVISARANSKDIFQRQESK